MLYPGVLHHRIPLPEISALLHCVSGAIRGSGHSGSPRFFARVIFLRWRSSRSCSSIYRRVSTMRGISTLSIAFTFRRVRVILLSSARRVSSSSPRRSARYSTREKQAAARTIWGDARSTISIHGVPTATSDLTTGVPAASRVRLQSSRTSLAYSMAAQERLPPPASRRYGRRQSRRPRCRPARGRCRTSVWWCRRGRLGRVRLRASNSPRYSCRRNITASRVMAPGAGSLPGPSACRPDSRVTGRKRLVVSLMASKAADTLSPA